MVGECVGKRAVGNVVLGRHHDTAGVLVETMDNAWPPHTANAGKRRAAVMNESVNQRAGGISRAGMDHQPGRLVDDDNVVILVENGQRYRFAPRLGGFGFGRRQADAVAYQELAFRLGHGRAPHRHMAVADQSLKARAGIEALKCGRQPLVKTCTGRVVACNDLFQCGSGFVIRGAHFSPTAPGTTMTQSFNDEDEKPLDPAVERVRRRVMRFIAINLGILFLALMAVAVAIVYRVGSRGGETAAETEGGAASTKIVEQGTITVPDGSRIVSQSLSGTLLSIEVSSADGGREFVIYDLSTGAVSGRVTIEPQR